MVEMQSKVEHITCPNCGKYIVCYSDEIQYACPHCGKDLPENMWKHKIDNELRKAFGEKAERS